MATVEIDLGVVSEGSLNTDLTNQLNLFTCTEVINRTIGDEVTDLVISRHIREIDPRDRVTYLFFKKGEDNELIAAGQVVFWLESGNYLVKPDRTNPLIDRMATFEFK